MSEPNFTRRSVLTAGSLLVLNGGSVPVHGETLADGSKVGFGVHWTPGDDYMSVEVSGIESSEEPDALLQLTDHQTVIGSDGFDEIRAGTFQWDGSTQAPTLTYKVPATSGRYHGSSVTRGDGHLLTTRAHVVPFGWHLRAVDINLRSPGHITQNGIILLGTFERVERTAETGETFEIVDATGNAEHIGEVLMRASNDFQVGNVPDRHVAVVAAVDGQSSPFRVGEVSEVIYRNPTTHVLAHEYVHTRQINATGWFSEGGAEYYAALLTKKWGLITEREFYDFVETSEDADKILTEPGRHIYTKGRRVCAALDVKIRRATGGEKTLQHVWGPLSTSETAIDIREAVSTVAGESVVEWLDEYLTTSAVPDVPRSPKLDLLEGGLRTDLDGDALSRKEEIELETNPLNSDTDADGLMDGREVRETSSDPLNADTDHDGISDQREVSELGTAPNRQDSDGDGYSDKREIRKGTGPNVATSELDFKYLQPAKNLAESVWDAITGAK